MRTMLISLKTPIFLPICTGGDKNRYLECIQSAADEIKALRVQLETAKSKLEKCDDANAEIKRLCDCAISSRQI